MTQGYYRFPAVNRDSIVFTSEDDLWVISANGGLARRLTSNLGEVSYPSFSPDGAWLAFVGREEGQAEVYVMPAQGGEARRLTYIGGCMTTGWTPDGKIIFSSTAGHWHFMFCELYIIDADGSNLKKMELGPARSLIFGPNGGRLLERGFDEPAIWKRYRGGTTGQLWIDANGSGEFQRFLPDMSNLAAPLWLLDPVRGERVFFVSDHEGAGNLYSCTPDGKDLERHTNHEEFYVRNPSTDGRSIVYHAGGDLYHFDLALGRSNQIPVDYHSPRVQRNRKFIPVSGYIEYWTLSPKGQAIALTARGKLFSFYNWEGSVTQHFEPAAGEIEQGETDNPPSSPAGIRYRLPDWLPDGRRLLAVTDSNGEERFVIFQTGRNPGPPELLARQDFGRPIEYRVHPFKDQIVFSNHRHELLFYDLTSGDLQRIDRGKSAPVSSFNWSPDGEWVVYSVSISLETTVLKLWQAASGETFQITRPVLRDFSPVFDPSGRYIYFLSYRTFNPVHDALHFEMSFLRGVRPYVITLRNDIPSPFLRLPPETDDSGEKPEVAPCSEQQEDQPAVGDPKDDLAEAELQPQGDESNAANAEADGSADNPTETSPLSNSGAQKDEPKKIVIDFDGIQDRVIAFPVPEGDYHYIAAAPDGKPLYLRFSLESALDTTGNDPRSEGALLTYNFEDQREETLVSGVGDFDLSLNNAWMIYSSGGRLRVIKAGEKPAGENLGSNRKTGWIDLGRVKVEVTPGQEWRQMLREAWRLQRDHFWTEDMSQVDWLGVYRRYLPLVDRVGSRAEFSDLVQEMQGELGTSHAYEFGGDYRRPPHYSLGRLGADFTYDAEAEAWRIEHIYAGDVWEEGQDSPLRQPGVQAREGDYLLAVNTRKLGRDYSPGQALVSLADEEVDLTLASPQQEETGQISPGAARSVIVRTLTSETAVRYREWVETNRRAVHTASDGRVGYVHIPNMGPRGYAEFHRGYLAEFDRDGLIVDVRFNTGGNVSSLILEKLARRRVAYSMARWRQIPRPYPHYAVAGPIIALTNEFAGSDGDIFSHAFKLMKIGPLVGMRTWGGVIGVSHNTMLVDRTTTTQPEYAFWFVDVGWGLENYGAIPDIEIPYRPQDYAAGHDPQLERATAEALRLLEENPISMPDFSARPSRAAPRLPKE